MAVKSKRANNFWLVYVFLGVTALALVIYQYRYSLYFREADRINIAVYSQPPFVYSYNPHKQLGLVVFFDSESLVNVPGGYGWYKLGSLALLGKIEGKRDALLKAAFAELIGAPVDYVYYPSQAAILKPSIISGREADYFNASKRKLLGRNFRNSISNLFDQLLLRRIFTVRRDRLVFLNTDNIRFEDRGSFYYQSTRLDARLKGLFYHDSILNRALKAVLVTDKRHYPAAVRLLRQVEGLGIKVIEIEVNNNLTSKTCDLTASRLERAVLAKLARYYHCQRHAGDSQIIKFVIGEKLGREFR